MKIALDAIDVSPEMSRRAVANAAVSAMAASLEAETGQIMPIAVVRNGNRYVLVDGQTRVQAARQLGWSEIWAEPIAGFSKAAIAGASAAANMVRTPLDALDRWRTVVRLQENGWTLEQAAAALGLNDRQVRQLDKLGRLHADVVELIEQHGVPDMVHLAAIASASLKAQSAATKRSDIFSTWGAEKRLQWHVVASHCRSGKQRLSAAVAKFDVAASGLKWDIDVFAEPGSAEEQTTADVAGFMKRQTEALGAEMLERKEKKQTAMIVEWKADRGEMKVPTGLRLNYGDPAKPKKIETVLMSIRPDGRVDYATAIDIAAERAREKKAADALKAKAKPGIAGEVEPDEGENDDDAPTTPAADISPVTKAGRDMIALAKTKALREALRGSAGEPVAWRNLCVMLVLAFHAGNVSVGGYRNNTYGPSREGEDLVRQLVSPVGMLDLPEDADLAKIVREALARVLVFGLPSKPGSSLYPDSGVVAEWIGNAIGAEALLPRWDEAEFLATVNAETLRAAAGAAGIKASKKAGDLRRELAGHAPAWRPPGATFGAPGPKPVAEAVGRAGGGADDGEEAEAA
jgi:hypothetical protein